LVAGLALSRATSPMRGKKPEKAGVVTLNTTALEYAKSLIKKGQVVPDGRGAWSEHQPSAEQENEFIRLHGLDEYAKWYLGIDEEHAENTKGRYKFPYGDFQNVHRCAVLAAASRAGQYRHYDIENAAKQLEEMIETKNVFKSARKSRAPSVIPSEARNPSIVVAVTLTPLRDAAPSARSFSSDCGIRMTAHRDQR
jgi:hypothetical protein